MAFTVSYKTIFTFVPNKKILVAGLFLGFHFALFFRSVQLTSIAEAALLGTISPSIYGNLFSAFSKKIFSLRVFFGLFLALFGAFILINQSSFSYNEHYRKLLAVLCSIAMAAVLIIGKEVRKKVGLFEYSRWIFLYASVCLFIISYFENVSVLEFQIEDFGWFVFLAAIPTMVGHNIFYFLVKSLSATTVAAVTAWRTCNFLYRCFFLFWGTSRCCCFFWRLYYFAWCVFRN